MTGTMPVPSTRKHGPSNRKAAMARRKAMRGSQGPSQGRSDTRERPSCAFRRVIPLIDEGANWSTRFAPRARYGRRVGGEIFQRMTLFENLKRCERVRAQHECCAVWRLQHAGVIPAKAGIHRHVQKQLGRDRHVCLRTARTRRLWIPAFAGMTTEFAEPSCATFRAATVRITASVPPIGNFVSLTLTSA
jgi:hypothetical protein